MPFNTTLLMLAFLAQAGLTCGLYALLTFARARAVKRGVDDYGAYELADGEDQFAARVSANLRNQFEAPVLFYAALIVLIQLGAVSASAVILAWIFVAGRVAHTGVQIFSGDVKLRGRVFTINFLALVGLLGLVAWAVIAP